jgi:hypothetical protein
MAYKPFNQLLHDACDPPAREAVTKYCEMKWGLICEANPDKYAVDLIGYKNDVLRCFIEVEVRDWGDDIYCPYQTIHIAHRKEKLFKNKLPTLMFVVTKDFKNAYWCRTEKIEQSPVVEIPNKAVFEKEFFYDVSIKNFKYVDLTELF